MRLFVGLDVSLAKTAICVISEHGKIIVEAEAASEPEIWCVGCMTWKVVSSQLVWRLGHCRSGFTVG